MRTVLSCAQMRAADTYTIRELGVSSQTLMERAGAAIAAETERLLAQIGGHSVLVVCGSGNNGGDGWCAARLLSERGFRTSVLPLTDRLSADGAIQRKKYGGPVLSSFPQSPIDCIVDAIFGTGFSGVPGGAYAAAIEAINASGARVVAADIPSGLNGDSGTGTLCVRADVTVAIGELKPGLLLGSGADVCGRIVRCDIGIRLPEPARDWASEASDFSGLFPPRRKNSHKGSYGCAAVLGGSVVYSGAPLLSAAAALRCGCGYTRLAVPEPLFLPYVGKIPEAILSAAPAEAGALRCDPAFLRELAQSADAIAVGMGCGVSRGVYDSLAVLLEEYAGTMIVDADAINAAAAYGKDILRKHRGALILTPHPKEFSRLSGASMDEIAERGGALAEQFAAAYGAVVLLKGNTSAITDGKRICYNTRGTPALAKGGSGDVLAGILASLAARGISAFDAACCGAYLLGAAGCFAAEAAGEYAVVATDVVAQLPRAIAEIQGSKNADERAV